MPSTFNVNVLDNLIRRPSQQGFAREETETPEPSFLPPYTLEPFPLQVQAEESATLVQQIQTLHNTTLDPSRWPINPEYRNVSNEGSPPNQGLALPEILVNSTSPLADTGSSSSVQLEQTNPTTTSPPRNELESRSDLISEALRTGEEIYAMHRRIMFDEHGNRTDAGFQARMSKVLLGEALFKFVQYVRQVRRSRTFADRTERSHMDRFLQVALKLQNKQITMTTFWTTTISHVQELQNKLADHHLELGIEELVTNISDIENRMALRNISQ